MIKIRTIPELLTELLTNTIEINKKLDKIIKANADNNKAGKKAKEQSS